MRIFMSIQHPDSVGKVRKILLFETGFHDSASDCTKLTLAPEIKILKIASYAIDHDGNCLWNVLLMGVCTHRDQGTWQK